MSGDIEKAAGRYWAAYHFIVDDLLQNGYMEGFSKEVSNGRYDIGRDKRIRLARKKAKEMLKSTMSSYKPLNFSNKSLTGRDHRNRFFKTIGKEKAEMIKAVEERHGKMYRLLLKEIKAQDRKYKYSTAF